MLILKGLIIFNLGYISFQDLQDREVYWFLFPSLVMLFGCMHYTNVLPIHFMNATMINLIVVLSIVFMAYLYTKIMIKRPFFKEVFGFGDLLFFIALALAFPTATFIILFVFSLLFSLSIWLFVKKNATHNDPPLAGYMSIFLLLIFIGNWVTGIVNLYLI